MPSSFLESHSGPLLIGAIANDSQWQAALDAKDEVDLFEMRLDLSEDPAGQVRRARELGKPVLLTLRAKEEGGKNTQTPDERIGELSEMVELSPKEVALVDVEVRTAQRATGTTFKALRQQLSGHGIGLVLSSHHLDTTPDKPNLLAENTLAKNLGADVFKVATTTHTFAEFNHLLTFAESALKDSPVAYMGMGNFGKLSRLIAAKTGSRLNYCALADGEGTALGQWTPVGLKKALAEA